MKITKMTTDSKSKDRVNIYFDGEYYATIDLEVVMKLKLSIDKELDLETIENIDSEQKFSECYSKSINLLSKLLKTKKQMKDYLYQKGYTKNTIDRVIEKLEAINLINDRVYCKKYVEQEKNKKGKFALKNALLQKGIESEIIDNTLSCIDSQDDAIINIAEKYMKNKINNFENIYKLKMYLLRKGFSYEEISLVVGRLYESGD